MSEIYKKSAIYLEKILVDVEKYDIIYARSEVGGLNLIFCISKNLSCDEVDFCENVKFLKKEENTMKKYSGEIIEIFLWIITFCLNIVAYFKHSNALFLVVVVLCIANIGVRLLTIKRK